MKPKIDDHTDFLLYAQSSAADVTNLCKKVRSDKITADAFEKECIFESLFLSNCKKGPAIGGAESDTDWNNIIQNALTKKNIPYQFDKNDKTANGAIQKRIKYLAAACITGFAVIGLILSLSFPIWKGGSHKTAETTEGVSDNPFVAEAVVSATGDETRVVKTDLSNSVYVIDNKTAGIVAEKTTMSVIKKDTSVYLSMKSGAVIFTVEKGRYRSFTVVTPHAKIRVTGTTFRVDATDSFTKVSVVEGSVRVFHDNTVKDDTIKLEQGNVAVATNKTINFFRTDSEVVIKLPQRKLLDSFLKSSTVHTTIGDTQKMRNDADSILKIIADKSTNTNLKIGEIYTAAGHLRENARYNDAFMLYEFILDNFDSSETRNNAAYWLTWTMIQLKTDYKEKRAISFTPAPEYQSGVK